MKKSLWMLSIFGFVAVFGGAQAAQAATACFDWDCTAGGGYCTFNASCSSATPYVWKYNFSSWGDGTAGTGLTGNPTQVHNYGSTGPAYPTVTMTIYFFDAPYSKTVSCDIVTRNVVGPPLPLYGRCSAS